MMVAEASGSRSKADGLEQLMIELGLKEDDLDDVIVGDEIDLPEDLTRWMVIAKVHIAKPYNQY